MCLDKLLDIPSELPSVGYKVFRKKWGKYRPVFSTTDENAPSQGFSIGKEYVAVEREVFVDSENMDPYLSGFHTFVKLMHAQMYIKSIKNFYVNNDWFWNLTIAKVKISDVTYYGEQFIGGNNKRVPCIVSRKMQILEEIV